MGGPAPTGATVPPGNVVAFPRKTFDMAPNGRGKHQPGFFKQGGWVGENNKTIFPARKQPRGPLGFFPNRFRPGGCGLDFGAPPPPKETPPFFLRAWLFLCDNPEKGSARFGDSNVFVNRGGEKTGEVRDR